MSLHIGTIFKWQKVNGNNLINLVFCFLFYRYYLNIVASGFVTLGALFDIGVWYYVENLSIFDEENQNEDNNSTTADGNLGKAGMEMKGQLVDSNGRLSISTITTASGVVGSTTDDKEKEQN